MEPLGGDDSHEALALEDLGVGQSSWLVFIN
jgi:hypothetical protein